ncbi:hypothetical protein MAC_01974 [Metarhizium acridum CQMa 102]|uniref:Uncharacterized protein n=1 Tax=Metarhizium acridum (strain CQMa 102) TaxID=655827 RepID=E9DWH6_METAQ|nr:uncharacterized protein MAC_01974 [Metarhizium acridum CQMa 102]EFY92026.1 hypothetical protein MAC_01974 [Metarhizium acridum CQMa 102]
MPATVETTSATSNGSISAAVKKQAIGASSHLQRYLDWAAPPSSRQRAYETISAFASARPLLFVSAKELTTSLPVFSRRTSPVVLLPAPAVRHLLPLHRCVRPRRRHHLRAVLDRHRAPRPGPHSAGDVVPCRAGMGLVGGQFPCREVALSAGAAEGERRGGAGWYGREAGGRRQGRGWARWKRKGCQGGAVSDWDARNI